MPRNRPDCSPSGQFEWQPGNFVAPEKPHRKRRSRAYPFSPCTHESTRAAHTAHSDRLKGLRRWCVGACACVCAHERACVFFFFNPRTRHSSRATQWSLGSRMSFNRDLRKGGGRKGTRRKTETHRSNIQRTGARTSFRNGIEHGEAPRKPGSPRLGTVAFMVCTSRPPPLFLWPPLVCTRRAIVSGSPDPPFGVVVLDNHRRGRGREPRHGLERLRHPSSMGEGRYSSPHLFSRPPDRTRTCAYRFPSSLVLRCIGFIFERTINSATLA